MLFKPEGSFNIIAEENYEQEICRIEQMLESHVNRGYFKSFDDAEIFYEYFLVENPKASVVFVHGYTEFTKKYYELSYYFMNMGYNIFLYDQRGHGLSHRDVEDYQVIHVNSYNDYAKDLDQFIEKIVLPSAKAIPVYLYGHSMGGAVALLYLTQTSKKIERAILSAPLVYPVCMSLPCFLMRFLIKREAKTKGWTARLRYSSDFNPDAKFEKSNDSSEGRFIHNLKARIDEPRYRNSCSSNSWNYETLGIHKKLLNNKVLKNVRSEILVITAQQDTVVEIKPQNKLVKKLKCKQTYMPNSKHSLYTQKDSELYEYVKVLLDFYNV